MSGLYSGLKDSLQGLLGGLNPLAAPPIPTDAASVASSWPGVEVPTQLWGDWGVASAGPTDGIGSSDIDTDAGSPTYQVNWGGPGGGLAIESSGTTSSVYTSDQTVDVGTGLWAAWVRFYNPADASALIGVMAKRQTDGMSIAADHNNTRFTCTANAAGSANVIITGITGDYFDAFWDVLFVRTSATRLDGWAARVGSDDVFTDDNTSITGADDYGDATVGFEFLAGFTACQPGVRIKAAAFWDTPAAALGLADFNIIRTVR